MMAHLLAEIRTSREKMDANQIEMKSIQEKKNRCQPEDHRRHEGLVKRDEG
jgi:hypothetical protein